MAKKSASVVAPNKMSVRKLKKVVGSAKAPITNAKQETPASTSAGKAPAKAKTTDKTDKAEAKPKPVSSGVNIGKTTGMRVMAFQDMTLARNDEPKFRLTDTELAKLWRDEFPQSRAVLNGRIDENIVRGVRNLYNQGMQGHGTMGVVHESRPYVIQDGKRVSVEYTRARKSKDEVDIAPAAPTVKKTVVKGAKKAATTVGSLPVPNRAKVVARKAS